MNWLNKISRTSPKPRFDFNELFIKIRKLAQSRGFKELPLGKIDEYPLLFLTRQISPSLPKILVSAGFHGEEPGGVFGVLKFLEESPDNVLNLVNLSILPTVNPTGIAKSKRRNDDEESTNGGFVHKGPVGGEVLSENGKILKTHAKIIEPLAKDGFVSLHEDISLKDVFYLYSFEHSDKPGKFSYAIRNALATVFKQFEDGEHEDYGKLVDGIVFRKHDGTYEDYLFHQGIQTACTETPGKSPMKLRAEANKRIIETLIKFVSNQY